MPASAPIPSGAAELIRDLAHVQRMTRSLFRVPETLTFKDLENLEVAKRLLAGQGVPITWNQLKIVLGREGLSVFPDFAEDGQAFSLMHVPSKPYSVTIGTRDVEVGRAEYHVSSAKLAGPPQETDSADVELTIIPASNDQATMRLASLEPETREPG